MSKCCKETGNVIDVIISYFMLAIDMILYLYYNINNLLYKHIALIDMIKILLFIEHFYSDTINQLILYYKTI